MSQRHPVFENLFAMEEAVADIERYGDLLMDLGTCDDMISPSGLFVTGKQLKLLGQDVAEQWKRAFENARGLA